MINLRPFFFRQLTAYASYHRHPKNRATHFIGIPAIVFSLLCLFELWHPRFFGMPLAGAWLVALVAFVGWVALDVGIGLAMALMLLPMLLVADWIAARGGPLAAIATFAIFFVLGWIFQLVGHMWEGKRPALVDNFFQVFIGPMFIVAEILILLGLRADLRAAVELAGVRHQR